MSLGSCICDFCYLGSLVFSSQKIVDSTYTNSELALKKFSMPKVRWVEKSMLPPEVTVSDYI